MAVPLATTTPGAGLWVAIIPSGTVASKSVVRWPMVSPASAMSWSASDSVLLRRSGTGTVSTPPATTTATRDPTATTESGSGSCDRMVPTGWSEGVVVETRVMPRPSASSVATSSVWPDEVRAR